MYPNAVMLAHTEGRAILTLFNGRYGIARFASLEEAQLWQTLHGGELASFVRTGKGRYWENEDFRPQDDLEYWGAKNAENERELEDAKARLNRAISDVEDALDDHDWDNVKWYAGRCEDIEGEIEELEHEIGLNPWIAETRLCSVKDYLDNLTKTFGIMI